MNNLLGCALFAVIGLGCGEVTSSAIDAPLSDGQAADAPTDTATGSVFPVTGDIVGGGPADGRTLVAWVVSSGSPDYVYKFGQGASTAAQFMVSFSGEPPVEALNSYGIGVGLVVVLAPGTMIPADGVLDEALLNGAGYTVEHSIIFKATGATPPVPWMQAFPEGFACGRCVRATMGFDSFVVASCSSVVVQMSPTRVCNWT